MFKQLKIIGLSALSTVLITSPSRADFSEEINLEPSNLEITLIPQKEKQETTLNLNYLHLNNVNSVSELKDINRTAWAFKSLQYLSESYGCSIQFSSTINHISRQQFAFNLNLCLNHISKLMTSSGINTLKKDDIATIQRLQTDFE